LPLVDDYHLSVCLSVCPPVRVCPSVYLPACPPCLPATVSRGACLLGRNVLFCMPNRTKCILLLLSQRRRGQGRLPLHRGGSGVQQLAHDGAHGWRRQGGSGQHGAASMCFGRCWHPALGAELGLGNPRWLPWGCLLTPAASGCLEPSMSVQSDRQTCAASGFLEPSIALQTDRPVPSADATQAEGQTRS
jgi:hypothetical protein